MMTGQMFIIYTLARTSKYSLTSHLNYPLAAIASAVGLIGIATAWVFYKKENQLADIWANRFGMLYKWTSNKFYFDEIYMFIAKKIFFKRVSEPFAKFDRKYVDGTMVGIGNTTVATSRKIKGLQSGRVQDYAFAFIGGAVIICLIFIYLWT